MKTFRMGVVIIAIFSFLSFTCQAIEFYDVDNPSIKKSNIYLNLQNNSRLNRVYVEKLKQMLELSLLFKIVDAKTTADYVLDIEKSIEDGEIVLTISGAEGSQFAPKYFGLRFRDADTDYIKLKAAQLGNRILKELFGITGSLGSTLTWSNLENKRKILYKNPFGIPENTEQITYNLFTNYGVSWNPERDKIIFTSHTGEGTVIKVQQLNPLRYKSIDVFAQVGKASSPYWAPDGSVFLTIHVSDQNSDIIQYSMSGDPYAVSKPSLKQVRKWTFDKTIETESQVSPDGNAMVYMSDQTAAPQIYLMDFKTGKSKRLTKKGGYNVTPVWSPDGKYIAYRGIRSKISSIYRINVNTGAEKRITSDEIDAESPTWSPDGSLIAFAGKPRASSSNISKIYYMLASGGEYFRLFKSPNEVSESNPSWGPALR